MSKLFEIPMVSASACDENASLNWASRKSLNVLNFPAPFSLAYLRKLNLEGFSYFRFCDIRCVFFFEFWISAKCLEFSHFRNFMHLQYFRTRFCNVQLFRNPLFFCFCAVATCFEFDVSCGLARCSNFRNVSKFEIRNSKFRNILQHYKVQRTPRSSKKSNFEMWFSRMRKILDLRKFSDFFDNARNTSKF